MTRNKTFVYKKLPEGAPVAGEHLVVEDRPIDLDQAPPEGGIVVEVLFASFDPYLRGRMRDPKVKSYISAFELDGPVRSDTVSRVLKSDHAEFEEGSLVTALLPIAEYARVPKKSLTHARTIANPHNLELGLFLGPLGMPGLTAWSGLYEIGKPKKGETIFVSSAAGAVGQVVGQVAKLEGLRVIGSVGSDEKLEFIKSIGYDDGFNYKEEKPADALARLAPEGIDIYFDNVGGEQLEAAIDHINTEGRIPLCGNISDSNKSQAERFPIRNLGALITKQVILQGFIVINPRFGLVYTAEHQEKLQRWLGDGSVKAKLHVTEGIDNAPEGLIGIFKGENFGKAVLKIKEAEA